MPCPEKFRDSLILFHVKSEIIQLINEGYEDLKSSSSKKIIAEYFVRAMEILDKETESDLKYIIMDYNACCKGGLRDKACRNFAKAYQTLDLCEKISHIGEVSNMGEAVLDKNRIIVTGIQWKVDNRFKCACPNFNWSKETIQLSPTYCLCCAGHFRHHYQNMLGIKLKTIEIVSSPLMSKGKKPCVFSFEII